MSAHHCGPFFPTGKQDRQARGNTDLYITYREKENRKGGLWARPTFGLGLEGRARGKVPELATSYRPWRADHRDNEALARLAEKLRPLLEKANPTMPPTLPSSLGLLYTLRHLVVPAEGRMLDDTGDDNKQSACRVVAVRSFIHPSPSPSSGKKKYKRVQCDDLFLPRVYCPSLQKTLTTYLLLQKLSSAFSFLSLAFYWNSNCAYSPG